MKVSVLKGAEAGDSAAELCFPLLTERGGTTAAGLTCGEELLTRGVDGARPFLGLHCGAITTGLERHRLSVEHSARGRARGRVVPEPLRPPTNFQAGGGAFLLY